MSFKGKSFDEIMGEVEKAAEEREQEREQPVEAALPQVREELREEVREDAPKLPEKLIDMQPVLQKAMQLFSEQAQMNIEGKEIGLADIELSEAKANAFLNAINNAISIQHLSNVVSASDLEFKREKEMQVYNPMLDAHAIASDAVNRKMGYVARQMNRTVKNLEGYEEEGVYLDSLGSVDGILKNVRPGLMSTGSNGGAGSKKKSGQNWEVDVFRGGVEDFGEELVEKVGGGAEEEGDREYVNCWGERKVFPPGKKPAELMLHLDGLQYVFDKTLGNMAAITSSAGRLLQDQRYSGAKQWGNSRAGVPAVYQPSKANQILRRAESEQSTREKELEKELELLRRHDKAVVVNDGSAVSGIGSGGSGVANQIRQMSKEEVEAILRGKQE